MDRNFGTVIHSNAGGGKIQIEKVKIWVVQRFFTTASQKGPNGVMDVSQEDGVVILDCDIAQSIL